MDTMYLQGLSVDVSTRLLSVGTLSGLQGVLSVDTLLGLQGKFIRNVDGVSTRHMNVGGDLQGIKLCTNKCTISFVAV